MMPSATTLPCLSSRGCPARSLPVGWAAVAEAGTCASRKGCWPDSWTWLGCEAALALPGFNTDGNLVTPG